MSTPAMRRWPAGGASRGDSRCLLMSGARGFLGSALAPALAARGWRVLRLVRGGAGPDELSWDPARGHLDLGGAPPLDAVIHLAGATIAGRWSAAQRQRIRTSRVQGTQLLAGALARLERRPAVLISTSAAGYYGDRGDQIVSEDSPPGNGFLADVVVAWERAADPARHAGIRVVHPRFGLVLSRHGGALPPMALPTRLGINAVFGSGRQWWSWVALDDLVAILPRLLEDPGFEGPVNVVAPGGLTQSQFARSLSRALHRPLWFRVPGPILKLALNGFAEETLLQGAHIVPAKLQAAGYEFRHPELEPFLRRELGHPQP